MIARAFILLTVLNGCCSEVCSPCLNRTIVDDCGTCKKDLCTSVCYDFPEFKPITSDHYCYWNSHRQRCVSMKGIYASPEFEKDLYFEHKQVKNYFRFKLKTLKTNT